MIKRRRRRNFLQEESFSISYLDGLEPNRILDQQKVSDRNMDVTLYDKDAYHQFSETGFRVISVNAKISKLNRSRNLKINIHKEKVRGI